MTHAARALLLKSKRHIFGFQSGEHGSIFQGSGMDFREIREYSFGDDVRKINWSVTARAQRPFVNLYNEERELNILIVFLVSGSIFFGTKRLKQELMAEILALLGYAALHNRDRLSILFFGAHPLGFYPPTKNQAVLEHALDQALSLSPLGTQSNLPSLCEHIASHQKKRSLLFLVGDFYGEADFSSIARRHEIYAIKVRDRFEESPELLGRYALLDPCSMQQSTLTLGGPQLAEYAALLSQKDAALHEQMRRHRIAHTTIYTDESPLHKLLELFRS